MVKNFNSFYITAVKKMIKKIRIAICTIILLVSIGFLVGCTSFTDSKEMNRLSVSYKTFCSNTEFVYYEKFLLNNQNIAIILSYLSEFKTELLNYNKVIRSVYYDRLVADQYIVINTIEITNSIRNFLELKRNQYSSYEASYDNTRTLLKLLNRLHNNMYIIESNRAAASDAVISDYIKYFIIFIIFFFILCIVILTILFFELKQKDITIKETSNFLNFTIKGQEEEKRRIARELHDTVAQDMRFTMQLTKKLDSSDLQKEILENQNATLKKIRSICSSCLPQDIENNDIVACLNGIFTKIKEETNIELKFTILNDINFKDMSSDRFLHFFRIIQESLNNAVIHSKCYEISILIKEEIVENVRYIHLIITDDGIGIDKQIIDSIKEHKNITLKNHFGIKNIIQRTQLLKGKIDFISDKDFGTEINLIFPLKA